MQGLFITNWAAARTVKVNACPPTSVSCCLWEALPSTSGQRCWMAPQSYETCLLNLIALKWYVKLFLVWWFLNLFWALTRLLHIYHPLKPSETVRGLTSPCTLRKNMQGSWQRAVFDFMWSPPRPSYFILLGCLDHGCCWVWALLSIPALFSGGRATQAATNADPLIKGIMEMQKMMLLVYLSISTVQSLTW